MWEWKLPHFPVKVPAILSSINYVHKLQWKSIAIHTINIIHIDTERWKLWNMIPLMFITSSRIQKTSPTWTQHRFGQIWWKEQYTGDGVINIEIDNNNYISVSVRMVHMLCHSHSGALEGLYELPDLLSWTPSMTMPWFYLGFNVRGRGTGVLPSLPGNRVEPETPISQYSLHFALLAILDGHPFKY